jgi:hypothetical protein
MAVPNSPQKKKRTIYPLVRCLAIIWTCSTGVLLPFLLRPKPWARTRLRVLMEYLRDMRRDRHVFLNYRNMVSYPEYEPGHLGMLRDEARDYRMRRHEPRKARMRVL